MAGKTGTKQLLDRAGLKTRTEVSRARSFIGGALQARGERIGADELLGLLELYKSLLALDYRNLSNIEVATVCGLGHVLANSSPIKLEFLSFASPEYVQNRRGEHANIGSGESKPEYLALRQVTSKLRSLKVPNRYAAYLADIDPEVIGKTPAEIEILFRRNLEGLRCASDMPTERLSGYIDERRFTELKTEARVAAEVQQQVKSLQRRSTVLAAHSITPKAIAERAITYVALGRYLEEKNPKAIILDVQGRIYPYEQPFYNTMRSFPLPLIRPVRIRKGE